MTNTHIIEKKTVIIREVQKPAPAPVAAAPTPAPAPKQSFAPSTSYKQSSPTVTYRRK